ncbi:MAG: adenylyltransferase/cytidyltransferase family protein [Clostridia bacterium]|nr:adenylyltransferase/cytidyltransferase family protein [Clostridia bacterium]
MKIGIYGGSFNPIHKKHVNVINELLDKYLDKIIIVPAGDKYSKSSLISARDRINMIELAIKPDKRKIVDNYECTNERRYTYETLNHMKKLYPDDEIYFVMGLDNLDWFDE